MNINWDKHKADIEKVYKKKGAPPIVAGNELPFVIYLTIHERIYWGWEDGHLQCSRPMINCSVQHLGDHKRIFNITNDTVTTASTEIEKKLTKAIEGSLKTDITGLGGAEIKGDFSEITGLSDKISKELKRHVGQSPEFVLNSHAPPCYEIVAPYGAYAVISLDGDAKITRWYSWDGKKGEVVWTNKIEMEPNPPAGYKVGFSVAFGLFQWNENYAQKVRPCDCAGVDRFENPPTKEEMHIHDEDAEKEGADKPKGEKEDK